MYNMYAKQSLHVNGMEELSNLEQELEAWVELEKRKGGERGVNRVGVVVYYLTTLAKSVKSDAVHLSSALFQLERKQMYNES